MATVKRLASLCLAAFVLAGPAGAATKPTTTTTSTSGGKAVGGKATVACRNRIINQWEGTGKISTSYPVACYKAALTFVAKQQDLSTYSSLGDDIRLALQARLRAGKGVKVPSLVVDPKYVSKINKHRGGSTTTGPGTTDGTGGYTSVTTTLAQGESSNSSSGTPLPILVLGGIAIVLVAAGAIGTGVRYQRRRGGGGPPAGV
jgi:hypothetical protein